MVYSLSAEFCISGVLGNLDNTSEIAKFGKSFEFHGSLNNLCDSLKWHKWQRSKFPANFKCQNVPRTVGREEIGEAVSVMSLQVLNVSGLYDMSLKLPTADKLTANFSTLFQILIFSFWDKRVKLSLESNWRVKDKAGNLIIRRAGVLPSNKMWHRRRTSPRRED